MVDTYDQWIVERTGIKERHILKGKGLGTSHMAPRPCAVFCRRPAPIRAMSMSEIASTNQSITEISGVSSSLTEMIMHQANATNEIAKNANSASLDATMVTDALKTMQDTIRYTQQATDVMLGFAADLSSPCSEIGEAMDTLVKAAAQTSTVKELANLARTSRR